MFKGQYFCHIAPSNNKKPFPYTQMIKSIEMNKAYT